MALIQRVRERPRRLIAYLLVALCAVAGVARLQQVADQANTLSKEVKASLTNQTHNRALNVGVWCGAINQGRVYERQYFRSTIAQTQAEARIIEKAIARPRAHGLTPHQAAFIRTYLDSVVALEREVPRVLSLHPYTLGDLPCQALERKTLASTKPH